MQNSADYTTLHFLEYFLIRGKISKQTTQSLEQLIHKKSNNNQRSDKAEDQGGIVVKLLKEYRKNSTC